MALSLRWCQISLSSQGGDGVERGRDRGEVPDSCCGSTKGGDEEDGDLRHEAQGQDVEKMPTAARADRGAGGRVGRRDRDEGRLRGILVFARPDFTLNYLTPSLSDHSLALSAIFCINFTHMTLLNHIVLVHIK